MHAVVLPEAGFGNGDGWAATSGTLLPPVGRDWSAPLPGERPIAAPIIGRSSEVAAGDSQNPMQGPTCAVA